jgi:hypothetical protein
MNTIEEINEEWKKSDKEYDETPEEVHEERRNKLKEKMKNEIKIGSRVKALWGKRKYKGTVNKIIKDTKGNITGYDILFDRDGKLGEVTPNNVEKIHGGTIKF